LSETNPPRPGAYFRNGVTYFGGLLIVASLLGGTFVFLQELLIASSPYSGLLYAAASLFLVLGFVLIPVGMLWERRRQRHGRQRPLSVFRIDLGNPEHVYVAMALLGGFAVLVVLVGVGSYKSFRATESAQFCGQLCHDVMNPEWVRYNASPHARVACAECHIGEGADWWVKSKLSGLRQVWAVTVDSYDRPIPTPIHDLRPARETCEQCHWRRRFTGYKELVRSYYLSDDDNTSTQMRMLVKIGGEKSTLMRGSGIHYHMLIANKVEYVATDEKRQKIAWVRVTRSDGSVTEYHDSDSPLSETERAKLETRTMDCMDCHNRPAHQFPTAMQSVDDALEDGSIARTLPEIKVRAVTAIDDHYENTAQAMEGIANYLHDYYKREYPEVFERKNADVVSTIKKVQQIYHTTVFPEMKASWRSYPSNIGHRDSPGCFRCHNDHMVSDAGVAIFTDCTRCHLILAQGKTTETVNVNIETGLPFVHPEDGEEITEYTDCSSCHTGGKDIYE
jgi:nitrate/TMAO reductase-like tetraheme cytochrome c subunit